MGFYIGTLLINIIVSLVQLYSDRNVPQKYVFLYWIGILASAIGNILSAKLDEIYIVFVCATGTFISQVFLAMCLVQTRKIKVNVPFMFLFYLAMATATLGLYYRGFSFEIFSFPVVMGAAAPLVYSVVRALRQKRHDFTTVQKMFLTISTTMSFHYLTWTYTFPRPQYLFIGSVIAFALLYLQSILIPMMVTEQSLQNQNNQLEMEVQRRASQLTETQNQLWKANKLASIGRIAGGVAHEINNPLAIIQMYAEDLRTDARANAISCEDVVNTSEKIQAAVARISKLTDGLRKVAKDHKSMERREFNFNQIVTDALISSSQRIKDDHITLKTHITQQNATILCNPTEIFGVIVNLIENAMDALAVLEKKEIQISLRTVNDSYELSVEDSGHIDAAIVPHIMEPFFSNKPVGHGQGLGLSIGRAIVENHGGRLYLDSTSPYTRFILELPKLRTNDRGDSYV